MDSKQRERKGVKRTVYRVKATTIAAHFPLSKYRIDTTTIRLNDEKTNAIHFELKQFELQSNTRKM